MFCAGEENETYFLRIFKTFLRVITAFCIFSNYLYDDITRISTKDVFSIGNGISFV